MLCLFSVYHMSIVYNRMFMQVHVYINMFYYIIIYVWCYVFLLLLDTEYAWIQLRGARVELSQLKPLDHDSTKLS